MHVAKHIPIISIDSNFTLHWFDAECHVAYRKKERAHKKFKERKNQSTELKFKSLRRIFTNMGNVKMRDNFYNKDDPELITKKFYSHVKSSSKSSRLPECMNLNGCFRNNSLDKAELFNKYLSDQFSSPSNYDIDINWLNDLDFDIDSATRKFVNYY